MVVKDVNLCCIEVRWDHDWPRWSHSSLDGTPEKIHPARFQNELLYQKSGRAVVRLQDLCDICAEIHWIRMRT